MTEVLQVDRDAAADYLDACGWDWGACGDVREGRVDHPVVPILASHRIAGQAELVEALGSFDAATANCPARKKWLGNKKCDACGAGPDEGCRQEITALHQLERDVRQALAPLSPSKGEG